MYKHKRTPAHTHIITHSGRSFGRKTDKKTHKLYLKKKKKRAPSPGKKKGGGMGVDKKVDTPPHLTLFPR